MKCLKCYSTQLQVVNSRKKDFSVWRRRICSQCSYIFTTEEKPDVAKVLLIKQSVRSKKNTPYSRGLLLKQLYAVLSHRSPSAPLYLVETIEKKLLGVSAANNFVITKAIFCDTVIRTLEAYDTLAALNYKAHLTSSIT